MSEAKPGKVISADLGWPPDFAPLNPGYHSARQLISLSPRTLACFFANGQRSAKRIAANFGYVTLKASLSGWRKIAQVSAIWRKPIWCRAESDLDEPCDRRRNQYAGCSLHLVETPGENKKWRKRARRAGIASRCRRRCR